MILQTLPLARCHLPLCGLLWLCLGSAAASAAPMGGATVKDAITLQRIQHAVTAEDAVAAFSPDGTQAAFVTWHGDLKRNTNVYELRLVDLRPPLGKPPRVVLTRRFPGERRDQQASPIKQLRFTQDGKAVTFLGLDPVGLAQAYRLDLGSGEQTQLTRHSTSVRTFAVGPDGKLLAFSAVLQPDDGSAQRLEEDGVFMWDTEVFPTQSKFTLISPVLSRLDNWNSVRQTFLLQGQTQRLIFTNQHLVMLIGDFQKRLYLKTQLTDALITDDSAQSGIDVLPECRSSVHHLKPPLSFYRKTI